MPVSALRRTVLPLLLWPVFAAAQIPGLTPKTAPAAEEAPAAPETIAIAAIPQRIERDQRLLQDIVERSAAVGSQAARRDELATIRRNADTLIRKTSPGNLRALPISGLLALERHLLFLDRELAAWQDDLQAAAKPLSEDAAQLAQMRELWSRTRGGSGELLVPAMQRRIDDLLAQFGQGERAVSAPLSQLLDSGYEAGVLQSRVARGLRDVRGRIAAIDRGLWRFDSEPLHTALAEPSAAGTDGDAFGNGLKAELAFMQEYDRVTRERTNAFLALSLLLLPLFLWLSRQAKLMLAGSVPLEDFRKTLTRPVSAWLLLSILGLLLLQIDGPALRLQLLLIVAWLPVMRLQPKRLLEHVGYWMYLTAVFFLVNLFGQAVANQPLLFRLVLLANDVLMLAALAWLLYRSVQRLRTQPSRLLQGLRAMAALGIGVMALAIAANLAGNVTLAAMLTDATLNSAYLGLFLFAVGTVVRAFTRLLLRSTMERLKSHTQHAGGLVPVVSRLFNLALVLSWLFGTLDGFRLLRPLLEWVKTVSAFAIGYGSLSVTFGGIVLFGVSVYLSFWLARTLRGVLSEDILPNMALPRGVANSVSSLSYYALLILGLLLALAAAGFHISQLAIVLGALSVGIGLGLQDVVKNFVSGLILMVERPVQPGDIAEVSGTIGKVREIGMRATTLTTFEGADVIVPNGMLLSEKMVNWTLSSDKRRIDIPVGAAYGSDPRRVLEILEAVAARTPGIARNPAPTVVFSGFGQSALEFSVRAWTDNYDDAVFVRSAMAVAIHDALREAGIEIPFPQR
ncbi:MAG: mechanosensitive ion channel domain-containing protein, partial [Arenimonas sp.]